MKIAIIKDTVRIPHWNEDWKKLCKVNSFDYKEFDSNDPDFIDQLLKYNPYRTLWRSGNSPREKIKDEAQRQFLDKTGLRIVPNWQTHYLYDHKIRQTYLLNYHNIPHPKTTIFWRKEHAWTHMEKAKYPFIIKTDAGAGSKSFKFVENKKQFSSLIDEAFLGPGRHTGRGREKYVLYTQEYIQADNVWRIIIVKNDIAFGYIANFRPGTLKASGQGFLSYMPVPKKLLEMARNINIRLGFDWMMYDFIWNKKDDKLFVLEMCDTIGASGHGDRNLTYYRRDGKWISKREKTFIQDYIFKLFVLDEIKTEPADAPGC